MAEYKMDCLGEACPIPLMKAEKKMAELKIGDILMISIDHSCAMKNLPEWAIKQGHDVEVEEIGDGEWDVIIEKAQ